MKSNRYPFLFLLVCCLVSFGLGAFLSRPETNPITAAVIGQAQKLIGLGFTPSETDSMLSSLEEQRITYGKLRAIPLANDVVPALVFNPLPAGFEFEKGRRPFKAAAPGKVTLPTNQAELAFYSVNQLAHLVRTRQLSSVELTRFFLERLKTHGPRLQCTITLTEELALQQAQRADQEIKAGKYRGPLHGIPYGAKDLLATKGYKTTWGAGPYRE